jgi:hypothetical protein
MKARGDAGCLREEGERELGTAATPAAAGKKVRRELGLVCDAAAAGKKVGRELGTATGKKLGKFTGRRSGEASVGFLTRGWFESLSVVRLGLDQGVRE